MPYFVILPLFGGAVLTEMLLLGICAAVPPLRRALPYGWRILVGSSLGFLAANLASVLVGIVPVLVAGALDVGREDPGARIVAGFALAGLFLGPLVVSPVGFLGGAWIGLRHARRARHVLPAR